MLRVAPRRGFQSAVVADEDRALSPFEREPGQVVVMLERRVAVAGRLGLRHPELDPVQCSRTPRVLFGMGDPVAGGHQVELSGTDQLLRPEAVEVEHLALDQPRHRLQAHVRVRAYAERAGRVRGDRAHVVGETPGADGLARPVRKDTTYRE